MPHFRDEIRSLWVHWEKRMYFLCNLPFFLLLITKEQKQAESNFLSPPREKVSLFFHIFVEYIITERNILLVLKFWTRFETVGSECDRKPKTDVHALEFNLVLWPNTQQCTYCETWGNVMCLAAPCTWYFESYVNLKSLTFEMHSNQMKVKHCRVFPPHSSIIVFSCCCL